MKPDEDLDMLVDEYQVQMNKKRLASQRDDNSSELVKEPIDLRV